MGLERPRSQRDARPVLRITPIDASSARIAAIVPWNDSAPMKPAASGSARGKSRRMWKLLYLHIRSFLAQSLCEAASEDSMLSRNHRIAGAIVHVVVRQEKKI